MAMKLWNLLVCVVLITFVKHDMFMVSAYCTATECAINEVQQVSNLPRDCTEISEKADTRLASGIYLIQPHLSNNIYKKSTRAPIYVFCDMDTEKGGWTVFQRRQDGLVDFYRGWQSYKEGFGYVNGDYWLGLQNLHWLTSTAKYELRVDLEDFEGNVAYAKYDNFKICEERLNFRLILGDYTGSAGDSMALNNYKDFNTVDRDETVLNCTEHYRGPWWHENCGYSSLNGLYMPSGGLSHKGITWYMWENNWKVMKKVDMKIRRIEC